MKQTVDLFNSGLNTRLAPHLLKSSYSIIYENCDNEPGVLKPIKSAKVTDTASKKYWTYYDKCDKVISTDTRATWVEYDDVLYEANEGKLTKQGCDGIRYALGIEKPQNDLELEAFDDGNLCGIYNYVYTYYNDNDGTESQPSNISDDGDASEPQDIGQDTNVTPEDPDREEKLDFYRMGKTVLGLVNGTENHDIRLEEAMCAIRHSGDFTIQKFTDYINESTTIYDGAGSSEDKYNEIICKTYGMVSSYDPDNSFRGFVLMAKDICGNEELNTDEKLSLLGCFMNGLDDAENVHGDIFEEQANKVKEAYTATFPQNANIGEAEWRVMQVKCVTDYISDIPEDTGDTDEPPVNHCKNFNISGITASDDPQVTHIRLYRIGGTLQHYSLVAELPNISQTFFDNKPDSEIAGSHVLDSNTYGVPPENAENLIEAYGMLVVSSKNRIYYSDVGRPNVWPSSNFITFSNKVTGLGVVQNGLIVFTKYNAHIVSGNDPRTLTSHLLNGEQGCVSHDTIAYANNNLYWLSTDGICASQGNNVSVVTSGKLGKFTPKNPVNAMVHDKMYILTHDGGSTILDLRYDELCIRTTTDTGFVGTYDDKMFIQKDGMLLELFSGEPSVLKYCSPILTNTGLSSTKSYKHVSVTYTGDLNIKIYVYSLKPDDNSVILQGGKLVREVNISGKVNEYLHVDAGAVGYGIYFVVEGTGTLHELNYDYTPNER